MYKVYSSGRTADPEVAGRTLILDTAEDFYQQLEEAVRFRDDVRVCYSNLRSVFRRAIEQKTLNTKVAFVGMFSKLDYVLKESEVPFRIVNLIQLARKDIFPNNKNNAQQKSEAELRKAFPHNVKAAALLVHWLYGKVEIPEVIKAAFPKSDRKMAWGAFDQNVLRVIVNRWDKQYIWATEEENNTTLQINYSDSNITLTREGAGSWDYLHDILWEGAQLNLVRVRMDGDVCNPELIILEPDYLINITTIAGCFETYAESPFVNLINKLKPQANSIPIHLGNLAGQFLDDTVHGRDIPFEDSIREFINRNAISMITCGEMTKRENYEMFLHDAKIQKENIKKLIGHDLPGVIGKYDTKAVVLEPSFFSKTLGIQGRLDFLYDDGQSVTIIEQKSGKGAYPPNADLAVPNAQEKHVVQLLLYRALFVYEFQRYAIDLKHIMLLYSKYSKGLLNLMPIPQLFLRAMKIRNLIAWTEILYAKEGFSMLETLTPELLNKKGIKGKLWDQYVRPQLKELLDPISLASSLERKYYLRFLRFLQNEQLLSKVGNKVKENSGFASIWTDNLEDKKSAGNIYDALTIAECISEVETEEGKNGCEDGMSCGQVSALRLSFSENQDSDTSNFRVGDIVMVYPYKKGTEPDACAQMVNRGTIVNISLKDITIMLRNPQTDKKIFSVDKEVLWAIEHDMFESSSGALYSAMHSFLSANKSRRDLLMCQRMPETDENSTLNCDFGNFNTLSLRAKQAKDIFLIIGPPGTGKTSYGLVNLLKEELSEAGSNILLLSYTNRAVDEICSKLVMMQEEYSDFDFIRIGSDFSCSAEYRQHLLSLRTRQCRTGGEVAQMIKRTRVFCGTTAALNANIGLFQIKSFSLAIVDESSQILEPHLIGLFSAKHGEEDAIKRFVLIGDHKQLPAVVQQTPDESMVDDKELNAINLTDCRLSLFERLLTCYRTSEGYDPRYVYMLTKQGRMHRDISLFPSDAFYEGKLDVVPLDHQLLPTEKSREGNGIVRLLSANRISFVACEAPVQSPSDKTNTIEAEMIAATVVTIYKENAAAFDTYKTVGVIVPYRNQIATVRNAIDRYGISELHDITIDTVERYQGSQRDYILYGFTIQRHYQLNFLANNVFEENGYIIDRKLNVAMTRARLNLVLFGNIQVLSYNPIFSKLIDYTKEKNSFYAISSKDFCSGNF